MRHIHLGLGTMPLKASMWNAQLSTSINCKIHYVFIYLTWFDCRGIFEAKARFQRGKVWNPNFFQKWRRHRPAVQARPHAPGLGFQEVALQSHIRPGHKNLDANISTVWRSYSTSVRCHWDFNCRLVGVQVLFLTPTFQPHYPSGDYHGLQAELSLNVKGNFLVSPSLPVIARWTVICNCKKGEASRGCSWERTGKFLFSPQFRNKRKKKTSVDPKRWLEEEV